MTVIGPEDGRYTTGSHHFTRIAEKLVNHEAAHPAYTAAVRDAYLKGRADAGREAVDALRDARLYVESSPGLAHTGRALLDRIDAILAAAGGQSAQVSSVPADI